MGLLNIISNEVKAAIGYQQNFADLLTAKDDPCSFHDESPCGRSRQ